MVATTAFAVSWQWAMSLGSVWIVTTSMVYRLIRMKRIKQHKEWMISSYVVTFAFVTFRVFRISGMVAGLGEFHEIAPAMGWTAWALPLLFTEVGIQWSKS